MLLQNVQLTRSDVEFLVSWFYLPFHHGPLGQWALEEFRFIRDNAHEARNHVQDAGPVDQVGRGSLIFSTGVHTQKRGVQERTAFPPPKSLFFAINPSLAPISWIFLLVYPLQNRIACFCQCPFCGRCQTLFRTLS